MTVEGVTSDQLMAGSRLGLRPLGFAYLGVMSLVAIFGIAGWIFGKQSVPEPVVLLTIMPVADTSSHHFLLPPPEPIASAITAQVRAGNALVADPALIEQTENGPLPRIAANGTTPMQAYAGPAPDAGKPRIAIVISGLGVSPRATASALAGLPPQITLAFAPFAADIQRWVSQARGQGHEVLLEVPMEPFDFPDSDEGPNTLRAGVAETANTQKLVWALTRMTGYTGITNRSGGRLLSDADSLEPVLTYIARRGLLFFDNGTAAHSISGDVAGRTGTAFAQASSTIDTLQTPAEIDRQLSLLESEARSHGFASGAGSIYPVTIQRVALWAQGLAGRGFVLVPVSSIVTAKK